MKRYKYLGAMLATGLLVANVHANTPVTIAQTVSGNLTVNLGYNPNVPDIYAVTHENHGDFTDIFKFRFTEPGPTGTADASYATLKLADIWGIKNVTFGLYNSSNVLVQSGTIIPVTPNQSTGFLSSVPLEYGSYYYKITGKSVGSEGSAYMFSQIVNPVPEPSTYALMLIGFLGLGYIGVRQARKASARGSLGLAA